MLELIENNYAFEFRKYEAAVNLISHHCFPHNRHSAIRSSCAVCSQAPRRMFGVITTSFLLSALKAAKTGAQDHANAPSHADRVSGMNGTFLDDF